MDRYDEFQKKAVAEIELANTGHIERAKVYALLTLADAIRQAR